MKYFSISKFTILVLISIVTFHSVISESSIDRDLTMSLEEKVILDKFRNLVQDRLPHKYMKADLYLVRWLRANRFDIKNAEVALINNLKWREDNRMDGIHQEKWTEFNVLYPYWLEGRDKEGKPILYFNVGLWDIRRAVIAGNGDRFMRHLERGIDEGDTLVRKLMEEQKNVTQGILLLNLDGYNLVEHGCLQCISYVLRGVLVYDQHYPGLAEKIILFNAPAIFEPLGNAVRQVFSPPTNKAMRIFGTNKNEWKSFLFESIERDQLPPEVGGTKVYKGMEDFENY